MTGSDPQATDNQILIADDDDLFRELVVQNLADKGFRVAGYPNGPAILAGLKQNTGAQIILLDWMMPGMTGIEVLQQLRAENCNIPVIFLTILSDQIYEEAALLGGAIDFVEKSRSFSILLKRIEVALSGAKGGNPDAGTPGGGDIVRGHIELRANTKRAVWKGRQVPLTLTEYHIVSGLAGNPGRDLSYRELYDLVHGEGFHGGYGEAGHRTNVRALIKRIRQKFRDIDPEFEEIENYPGFGYRWRGDAD